MIDIMEFPKIWYHGTHSWNCLNIFENGIDLSRSRPLLDFGPGFYVTSNYQQALKQAKRVATTYNKYQDKNFKWHGTEPKYAVDVVIKYILDQEALSQMEGQIFTDTNEDWAEFILGNRSERTESVSYSFHNKDQRYDYVYGPLADGMKIPHLILDYEEGIITKDQFLDEISRFEFPQNNQLSIHTIKATEGLILKEVMVDETEFHTNA